MIDLKGILLSLDKNGSILAMTPLLQLKRLEINKRKNCEAEAIERWSDLGVNVHPPEDDSRGLQENWESPLQDVAFSTLLLTSTTPTDKAR